MADVPAVEHVGERDGGEGGVDENERFFEGGCDGCGGQNSPACRD